MGFNSFGKRLGNFIEQLQAKKDSDEYLVRLRQVNTGMFNPGNPYLFDYAISRLKSENAVVEIGSFCGLSTNLITYYLRKAQKTNPVFTCDLWDYSFKKLGEAFIGQSSITGTEWGQFVKETFMRNVAFFSRDHLPYSVQVDSRMFFEQWATNALVRDVFGRDIQIGGPIAFCFIDGNHEYAFVKGDFDGVDPFVEPGGYVLFDDSALFSGSAGVRQFMDELAASRYRDGRYRLVMRNPNVLLQRVA